MKKMVLFIALLTIVAAAVKPAQASDIDDLRREMKELQTRIDGLEEKETFDIGDKLHFHGYGELHYNSTSKEGQNDKMDFHRAVIGLSYEFTDKIIFDTEVDFEHAASEMELEYAHLSFLLSEAFNFRLGSMLMPVGYLNEFHEPVNFYSVERPYVQKYVIPTTWQEGGAGIFGSLLEDSLNYRLYVIGGLDASKFKADSGIRKGRGKVASAISDDLAVVGRLEYAGILGLDLGLSGYFGEAGQKAASLRGADVGVSILEGDVRYRWKNLEFTGLVASVSVDDTEAINDAIGEVIGEEIFGWYVEGAYHLGDLFFQDEQDLVAFLRHEQFDTQEDVGSGLTADPANERKVTTVGLAYYPIPQVAIKADLESWEDGTGADWQQFNLGIAYEY